MAAYEEFDLRGWRRWLHALARTFPLGTWFGVPVDMYWAAAVVVPLLLLRWIGPVSATWPQAFALTAIGSVLLFTIVWTHEMGHIVAARRHRIPAHRIALSPLGGVAHLAAPARGPGQEIAIALAGPATHVLWLAIAWPLQQVVPAGLLAPAAWSWSPVDFTLWFLVTTNGALLLFNLLPIWPLDGGRTLRALLARRVHPNRATLWATQVGLVGGACLMVYGLLQRELAGALPFVIGLSCLSASLQERRAARYVPVYHHVVREPWESDPDAWRRGDDPFVGDAGASSPAAPAARGARRSAARAAAAAERDAALDREVDRVLERLHEVGMHGLTGREKAVLKRAAKRRRGTG